MLNGGAPFDLFNISIFQPIYVKPSVMFNRMNIQTERRVRSTTTRRAKCTKTSLLCQTEARQNWTTLLTWKSAYYSVSLVKVAGFTPFAPVGASQENRSSGRDKHTAHLSMFLCNGRTFSCWTYAMVLVPKCDDGMPRIITQTCQSERSRTTTDTHKRRRVEPPAGSRLRCAVATPLRNLQPPPMVSSCRCCWNQFKCWSVNTFRVRHSACQS